MVDTVDTSKPLVMTTYTTNNAVEAPNLLLHGTAVNKVIVGVNSGETF